MVGPRLLWRSAVALTLLAVPASILQSPAEAAAKPRATGPLAVTIAEVTPGAIPDKGPIVITGTVRNDSDENYRAVKIYALTSAFPMTTAQELADAAAVDVDVQVGERITSPGAFAVVGALAPGASATYELRVKRSLLPTAAGVYWLGVHALGATAAGRDDLADGKARTFVPLVPRGSGFVDTALAVQIRHPVSHESDGSLADLPGWAESLAVGGDLSRVLDLGEASGSRSISWLVDPAVPDAIARLAARNPTRHLGPSTAKDRHRIAELSQADPDAAGAETGESSAQLLQTSRAAKQWLSSAKLAMAGDDVLVLPYGDLDLPAAAAADERLYRRATRLSVDGLHRLDLTGRLVAAPPGGYLDEAGLDLVSRRTPVLVSDRALIPPDLNPPDPIPGVVKAFGRRLLVSSSQTATGGPDPGSRLEPIQLRQRILAEAALRLLGDGGPLVVTIPPEFDPGGRAAAEAFFTGLDQPWLRLSGLSSISRAKAVTWDGESLTYPEGQQERELTSNDLAVARRLSSSGRLLDGLLPENATVGVEVEQEALASISYAARDSQGLARARAEGSTDELRKLLSGVVVDANPVTLSSASGVMVVSVANQLDLPVRIRLKAVTDPGLKIEEPDVIDLAPGERSTERMTVRATRSGVHNISLRVTDEAGRPVGGNVAFQLRSSQVSQIIWVVFAVGGILLFGAIGMRLYRRVRAFVQRRGAAA